jgi:hypothetical protein
LHGHVEITDATHANIRECDVPLVGRDLIPMERSLMWWNSRPRHAKCVISMPSLISIPQSALTIQMFDFDTKMLI